MPSRVEKNRKQRNKITKELVEEKTKKISIKVIKVLLVLFIILSIIYLLLRYVGTSGLVVREYMKEYDNLPEEFNGLKIVQISDLKYNSKTVDIKKVQRMVRKINILKPDIVVFTGDLIYGDIDNKETKKLTKELSKIKVTLNKYSVSGDKDNDKTQIILNNAGFINIDNNYDLIFKDSNTPILITGFTNELDLDKSFEIFKDAELMNIFTIGIMHNPDLITEINNYHKLDIAFAGHNFNGLIRLPKIGGVFNYNCEFVDSYYDVDDTDLFISNGVGTEKYPYRLLNHPSISLYRIKKSD